MRFDSSVSRLYATQTILWYMQNGPLLFHLDLQLNSTYATRFRSALIVHKLFVNNAVGSPHDLRKVKVNGSYLCLQSAAEHKGRANRTNVVISGLEMVPPSQSFLQHFHQKKVHCNSISQNLSAHQTPFCKCM